LRGLGQPLTIMTNKELLSNKIDSILYWAKELKEMKTQIDENGVYPSRDDLFWIAYVMQSRGDEIKIIIKEDEFN